MMSSATLKHKFVIAAPEKVEEGVLYVSVSYRTVIHKCCCGCGEEVVTPLSPTDWHLKFDGVSVSLYPSIGNWSLACRSHYWIDHNKVKWAPQWSDDEVAAGREHDRRLKDKYFGIAPRTEAIPTQTSDEPTYTRSGSGFWSKLTKWWS